MFQVFIDGLCTPLGLDLTDGPEESVALSRCDCIHFAIGPYMVELRATTETPVSGHDNTEILGKLVKCPVQWPRPRLLGVDVVRLHAILQPHDAETIPEGDLSDALVGSIVVTAYNGRPYRIRGLKQPALDEREKLEKFYRERHHIQVTIDEPLLWAWEGLPVRALEFTDGHPAVHDGWFRHELKPAPPTVSTSSRSKKKSPILLLPQLCTAFRASDVVDALRFVPSVQDAVWWYSRVGHLAKYITVPRPTMPCWHDRHHFLAGTERAFFLLLSALTWPGEYRGAQLELLEWFGDTVVDVLASVEAHERDLPMVDAEALRGGLVSNAHLASLGPVLPNVPSAILGKSFRVKSADHKALADTVEAVVGALTLAYDVACAKTFLEALRWYDDPPCQPRATTLSSTSALVGKAVTRFLASYVCVTTPAIDVSDFHVLRQRAVDNANWKQVADAWWSGAPIEALIESTGMVSRMSMGNSSCEKDT